MNSDRQKKYDVFIKLHKKTYPLLEKKETVYSWARPIEPREKRSGKARKNGVRIERKKKQ